MFNFGVFSTQSPERTQLQTKAARHTRSARQSHTVARGSLEPDLCVCVFVCDVVCVVVAAVGQCFNATLLCEIGWKWGFSVCMFQPTVCLTNKIAFNGIRFKYCTYKHTQALANLAPEGTNTRSVHEQCFGQRF